MLFRGSPYRYLVRLRISMEIGDLVMLLAWARHHVPTAHQSTWNAGISQYSLPCPPNPPASQHSTKKKKMKPQDAPESQSPKKHKTSDNTQAHPQRNPVAGAR